MKAAFAPLHDTRHPAIVLFLTDGLPTVGEQNEAKIAADAKQYNKVHAHLFTFGLGYDLNSRLLDKLAREGFGQSDFVRPNENIEDRVSALYRRIERPVLADLSIKWDFEGLAAEDGKPVNRVYPKNPRDLFAGQQLVMVGRYRNAGDGKIIIKGRVGDKVEKFDFPAKFVEHSHDDSLAFIEKLWAIRRVGEILDELDLKGKNEELIKELITLSRRHGILTPYTSFMADDNAQHRDVTSTYREAAGRLDALKRADGQIGVEQRAAKDALRSAATPAAAAPAQAFGIRGRAGNAVPQAGPMAGGGSGGSGFYFDRSGQAKAGMATHAGTLSLGGDVDSATGEAAKVAENVRSIGSKVFYRRGDKWVDSTVTAAQEKQPIKIERYSKDYFDLIDKFGSSVAKYMTFDQPVVIELDGKAYTF